MVAMIDIGAEMVKAGFTGTQSPTVLFPPLVSRQQGKIVVGEAEGTCPIKAGVVTNWDDMEHIYRHAFIKLGVSPSAQPLIITNSIFKKGSGFIAHDMEKAAEILLNKMGVPAFFPTHPAVVSSYAMGKLNGLVVQSGESLTQVVPIVNGYAVNENILTVDVNGADLTSYFKKLLVEQGHSFTKTAKMEVYKDMKEKLCKVAANVNQKYGGVQEQDVYKLPDSSVVTVGQERYQCTEALFNPALVGKSGPGIADAIHQCIQKCDAGVQKTLYSNIALAGGNALLPGLKERVKSEVTKLASPISVDVNSPGAPKDSAYLGGVILGGLDDFKNLLITKEMVEKDGLKAFILNKPN